jgi:hypothetical protein
MKVFKRTNGPASPDDMAGAARLQAITDRSKIEVRAYAVPDTAIAAQGPQRLFRRPDEIVAASSDA